MSYLVLARKWRPQSFDTLVGQEHVVRALSHALSSQRLHHAWLFTGTRGVGKTTLARILAKSLNCEQGISPSPCGVCQSCSEIDSGRFVDYIELDAASNRGIDEMTQLLEQAIYAPSVGRFKVYVIDEVHMLTGPAFNAMLKTLEEPPAHVKFILATTDPQKIPATILSRCLQFNLKQMAPDSIISHLDYVLGQENINFEVNALRLIAKAANGSMRDALSLTDQAIAFSSANLTATSIQSMLGFVDQTYLIKLLQAIVTKESQLIIEIADSLSEKGLSFSQALAEISVLLSNIAIEQNIPNTVSDADPLKEHIKKLAQNMHANTVHLLYTVAVHSRNELSLSPDEYAGFVMACFRMMSLAPETSLELDVSADYIDDTENTNEDPDLSKDKPVENTNEDQDLAQTKSVENKSVKHSEQSPTVQDEVHKTEQQEEQQEEQLEEQPAEQQPVIENDSNQEKVSVTDINSQTWPKLVKTLPLSGAVEELARQSEWISYSNQEVNLRMAVKILGETSATEKLQEILSQYFGFKIKLSLQYEKTGQDTAFAQDEAHKQQLLQQAKQDVHNDVFIQALINQFQGQVIEDSIKPAN